MKIIHCVLVSALVQLGACQPRPPESQLSGIAFGPKSIHDIPPAAQMHAEELVDRFEDARRRGMRGVAINIAECYYANEHSILTRLQLRDCMVMDFFAFRYNREMERQTPGIGGLPFYEQSTLDKRLAKASAMARFNNAQVLTDYVRQGSDTMFAIKVARGRLAS